MPVREKNLVTFSQHVHPSAVAMDVSQSISRFSKTHTLEDGRVFIPTLTTSSKLFWLPRARLLSGEETLIAQGFPTEDPKFADVVRKTPQKLLHDLSGNAMSSTVVGAVFCSMMLAVPWAQGAKQKSDVLAAAALSGASGPGLDQVLSALHASTANDEASSDS